MNVTELARQLKIPTSEFRELLPRLGFDIGRKAIKIDNVVAQKIIKKFHAEPDLIAELRGEQDQPATEEPGETAAVPKKEIAVPPTITVRDFAEMLHTPVAMVIQELMKNGILANLNEQIDYETASIIAQDFGFQTQPQEETSDTGQDSAEIESMLKSDDEVLQERPPVIVVMGHVDHGKTQLLDTIRKENIIASESGGITQHIGAYQVNQRDKTLTFIDTPGHEAFTAMRSRGARVADIAILVVAADDGIKPQTEEAIQIINNAKLPFVVAINKIDKPEADIEKVKQQLAHKNLLPEDWGGQIITVPLSAKTGEGVPILLDNLVTLADVEKDRIQADPNRPAVGTIIESRIDKGEGPVATAIIKTGTLHRGDTVRVGNVVGKIRLMKDYKGETAAQAPPSMPVKILGLKDAPDVGDFLQVVTDGQSIKQMMKSVEKKTKAYRDKQAWQRQTIQTDEEESDDRQPGINIMLKTDVLGSQEAIMQSLETLGTDDVPVRIVQKGLGNITETDVLQAEGTQSLIYGFNIKATPQAEELAGEKDVTIKQYTIIYDLIDDVKQQVEERKPIKREIIELGRAKVLAIFRTEKDHSIVGCLITKGKFTVDASVRILRNNHKVGTGTIKQLKKGQGDVSEIPSGTECGVQLQGVKNIREGDIVEAYTEELHK